MSKKTVFRKFGQHSLKGTLQPDGRFSPDLRDATKILLSILGFPSEAIDTRTEFDSPLDAWGAFMLTVLETKNRPETIVFIEWLYGVRLDEKPSHTRTPRSSDSTDQRGNTKLLF